MAVFKNCTIQAANRTITNFQLFDIFLKKMRKKVLF